MKLQYSHTQTHNIFILLWTCIDIYFLGDIISFWDHPKDLEIPLQVLQTIHVKQNHFFDNGKIHNLISLYFLNGINKNNGILVPLDPLCAFPIFFESR
jgi:hypothetical protein